MINTKASAVIEPTPGCVRKRCASGHFSTSCSIAALSSANDAATPKIRSAAQRAIELDPTLAEPHAALAGVKEQSDWDWAAAEGEYRKAIGLNPNDATSHHW